MPVNSPTSFPRVFRPCTSLQPASPVAVSQAVRSSSPGTGALSLQRALSVFSEWREQLCLKTPQWHSPGRGHGARLWASFQSTDRGQCGLCSALQGRKEKCSLSTSWFVFVFVFVLDKTRDSGHSCVACGKAKVCVWSSLSLCFAFDPAFLWLQKLCWISLLLLNLHWKRKIGHPYPELSVSEADTSGSWSCSRHLVRSFHSTSVNSSGRRVSGPCGLRGPGRCVRASGQGRCAGASDHPACLFRLWL